MPKNNFFLIIFLPVTAFGLARSWTSQWGWKGAFCSKLHNLASFPTTVVMFLQDLVNFVKAVSPSVIYCRKPWQHGCLSPLDFFLSSLKFCWRSAFLGSQGQVLGKFSWPVLLTLLLFCCLLYLNPSPYNKMHFRYDNRPMESLAPKLHWCVCVCVCVCVCTCACAQRPWMWASWMTEEMPSHLHLRGWS